MTQATHDHLVTSDSLLRKNDLLREKNIGKHIPLPQLVVVGDQSSGKSSLLESLTGIPFPRDVALCTRYATQITQRRGDQFGIDVSIIPGPNASEAHRKWVEAYHRGAASLKEFREKFAEMAKESENGATSGSVFSEDVLKIEIRGRDVDYLTVIDVPGIFRYPTPGVTTKEDIVMVENMVRGYIKDNRTVILAVLASNIDIANQGILTLAEEYDPKGERTLGILTKPDLVTEQKNKAAVCNIVRGNRKQLALGYYVIRSRGADQGDGDYEGREALFQEEPWSSLPKERVGVKALKKRLAELLEHITRRDFPKMRKEVGQMLQAAERERDSLGPSRKDEQEQRRFLIGLARRFEDLVRAGLEAQYATDDVFDDSDDLRLITQIVNLADNFNEVFYNKAALRSFEEPHGKLWEEDDSGDEMDSSSCFGEIDVDKFPELQDIIGHDDSIEAPEDFIMDWIKDLYLRSRGMQLGTFSHGVWSAAWKEQSRKWPVVSRAFMNRVVLAIHRFMTGILQVVCADSAIREELWSAVLDEMLRRYEAGIAAAELLVSAERETKPYTLDRHFNVNRQRCRGERIANLILDDKNHVTRSKYETVTGSKYETVDTVVTIRAVREATQAISNLDDVTEKLHDDLASYYEIARKRFVDNVLNQAVNYSLLFGPSTPLKVFSQEWVISLEADQLKAIAGESPGTTQHREMLEKKILNLKEAKDILR
ncbi:Golgi transport complex subunit 4 [Collariella sp. IMI 366227]|nr:Golgi transport complex subunit 4 [Collariella sp. IMI 366227]